MEELRQILIELSNEFSEKQAEFVKEAKLNYNLRIGKYAAEGTKRSQGLEYLQGGIAYDLQGFYQVFSHLLLSYNSGEKLYNYISDNNLWHDPLTPFKGNTITMPNEVGRVGGGFLCRNFEINNQFIIDENSFELAYNELKNYFLKDSVSFEHYIHLKGLGGNVDEIIFNEDASIVRAGHEIAKYFSLNYTLPNYHDVEVYEDDYLLKIKFVIPKEEYRFTNRAKLHHKKQNLISKWENFTLLRVPNLVIFDKQVQISKDWVQEINFASGPYGSERRLWTKPEIVLTTELSESIQDSAKSFASVKPIKELDKKILYSLARLKKSKRSLNIDDRVVDLAIAFEYLINTSNSDVTLQLCLKLIRLISDKNSDDEIFNKLKAFYNLRSKVIHGNDVLISNENSLLIINYAEKVIRQAVLKMIYLNQTYTYKQIDSQLVKALYRSEAIDQLLMDSFPN